VRLHGNRRGYLPDDKLYKGPDCGNKLSCCQPQILKVHNVGPHTSDLFDGYGKPLGDGAIFPHPGLLQRFAIDDYVVGFPSLLSQGGRIKIAVAEKRGKEAFFLVPVRLRGKARITRVMAIEKGWVIGINKKATTLGVFILFYGGYFVHLNPQAIVRAIKYRRAPGVGVDRSHAAGSMDAAAGC